MGDLDQRIADAAKRQAAAERKWKEKHLPVRVGDKTVWLSTSVPEPLKDTLQVLPAERESGNPKRTNQIKTRLSDEELEAFELLVKTSGLPQGEYIRSMVLHGRVAVTQTSYIDGQTLELLAMLSAQLGKISGMIRQTVIVNKEFHILDPAEKARLEGDIHRLRQLQNRIQYLAEVLHGYLQA